MHLKFENYKRNYFVASGQHVPDLPNICCEVHCLFPRDVDALLLAAVDNLSTVLYTYNNQYIVKHAI